MDETPLAISQQMERHSPSNPVEETAGTAPTEAVTAKRRRQRKATPQIEQGASQIDQSYMVSLRAKLDPIMKGSEESTIPLETTLDHERQRRRKRRRRRAAGGEIQETEDTVSRAISFQTSNIEEGAPPLINDNRNTSDPDNIDGNRRSQTALDSNDDHQQQHNTLIGSDETDRIDNQRDPNGQFEISNYQHQPLNAQMTNQLLINLLIKFFAQPKASNDDSLSINFIFLILIQVLWHWLTAKI
jgi:hypothetical protein